ncbi:hypothetical protein CDSE_0114 [Candidatus Kinetoplastibacterium desouzaii TCC079E]|uniref:SAM-dependent methyltransferase n=1 Tax=Candidatus Kinetoplastidibacterium desouzai TCC079E TaxID=1208919 RepID=M1LVE5_9PROT|nr:SAM-dependent methyltransferase [Candidatus Kinetoplastibacterium desouzaii]AGF47224.1 hypothetical protein CDSE_0114 [Candidatus Kinetoplastibacterium desouzaii TCC079E]
MRNRFHLLELLNEESNHHIALTKRHLCQEIKKYGGSITFEHWMDQALYAPSIGYYSSNKNKLFNIKDSLSAKGDFVTAPELTPVFAKTFAKQLAQVLNILHSKKILEFGAGTGRLALDLIKELDLLGIEVEYEILDISNNLKLIQKETLKEFSERVKWLDSLPENFNGCIIANEVIDAIPVKIFECSYNNIILEKHIGLDKEENFIWVDKIADDHLTKILLPRINPTPGYISEINIKGEAWLRTILRNTTKGIVFIIDYGFPQKEYYHPQRDKGTLMCHLHHFTYSDPFFAPGIQDITAHVDFTALANIAIETGCKILGYTSLARFLLNCGIFNVLETVDISTPTKRINTIGPVQKLLSENEMGELFKVICFGINFDQQDKLMGFITKDRSEKLLI